MTSVVAVDEIRVNLEVMVQQNRRVPELEQQLNLRGMRQG